MPHTGQVVGLLGARYTGKTTLARNLCEALIDRGWDVVLVPDESAWLGAPGSPSRVDLVEAWLRHRQRAIELARQAHRLVLVDNLPLLDWLQVTRQSGDGGGNASWIDAAFMMETDLNLLLSTDLLWTNANAAEIRIQEALDAEIRSAMRSQAMGFEVVAGAGQSRLSHALAAVEHLLDASERRRRVQGRPPWRWICARCDDGECEQRWLIGRG